MLGRLLPFALCLLVAGTLFSACNRVTTNQATNEQPVMNQRSLEQYIFFDTHTGWLWADGFAVGTFIDATDIEQTAQETRIYITLQQPGTIATGDNKQTSANNFGRLIFNEAGTPDSPAIRLPTDLIEHNKQLRVILCSAQGSSSDAPRTATLIPASAGVIRAVHMLSNTYVIQAQSMGGSQVITFQDETLSGGTAAGRVMAKETPGMIGITAISEVKLVTPYAIGVKATLTAGEGDSAPKVNLP